MIPTFRQLLNFALVPLVLSMAGPSRRYCADDGSYHGALEFDSASRTFAFEFTNYGKRVVAPGIEYKMDNVVAGEISLLEVDTNNERFIEVLKPFKNLLTPDDFRHIFHFELNNTLEVNYRGVKMSYLSKQRCSGDAESSEHKSLRGKDDARQK